MFRQILFTAILALLVVATYCFAKFQGGFSSWFLFYSSTVFCLYELWVLYVSGREIDVNRTVPRTVFTVGEEVEVKLMLGIKGRSPVVFVRVEDVLPLRLSQGYRNRVLLFPWFRKEQSFIYRISRLPRGKFELSQVDVTTGDVFGLFERTTTIEQATSFIVQPKVVPVRWQLGSTYQRGWTHATNRIVEDAASVSGIRDYAPGDRLTRVHWQATAKTGQLKSKEFELHASHQVLFVLDQYASSYIGEAFELAVTVAASLISFSVQRGYQTGVVCTGDNQPMWSLQRGTGMLAYVMNRLAVVRTDAPRPLEQFLLDPSNHAWKGSALVLITGYLHERLVKVITMLRYRSVPVEVFLVTREADLNRQSREIEVLNGIGVSVRLIRTESDLAENSAWGIRGYSNAISP